MRAMCSWRADSASAFGAIQLLGERKLRIALDAAELVHQFGFGFRAHAGELGVQRFAGLGLGGETRLGDRRFTRGGGFALDPRQFRDALLGGLGAHTFEFCGELGVGHRLHEGDLRRVHFRDLPHRLPAGGGRSVGPARCDRLR